MLVLFVFLDCKRPSIRRWKLKTMLDQLQVLQILTPVLTMIVITGYHVSNSMLNSGKLCAILALHRGVSWWKAPCTKCTKEFGFPGWTFWKKSLRCDMCHYSPRMPTTRWNVWSLSQLCNRGAALEASFDDARREAVCIYSILMTECMTDGYDIFACRWIRLRLKTSLLAGGTPDPPPLHGWTRLGNGTDWNRRLQGIVREGDMYKVYRIYIIAFDVLHSHKCGNFIYFHHSDGSRAAQIWPTHKKWRHCFNLKGHNSLKPATVAKGRLKAAYMAMQVGVSR